MRKFILCSTLILMAFSAFAEDPSYINEGATCSSTSLSGATGGNVNLRTVYQAKSIPITWESNGQTYTTTTCTYDTQLQLPAAPSARLGYTFDGWTLYQAPATCPCSMPTVNTSTNGTTMVCLDLRANPSDGKKVCTDNGLSAGAGTYGVTNPGEWAVNFSYGLVNGDALCSSTEGTDQNTGNPVATNGQHCWCRITSFTPSGGAQCSFSASSWVHVGKHDSYDSCGYQCSYECSYSVLNKEEWRGVFYAVLGQGTAPASGGSCPAGFNYGSTCSSSVESTVAGNYATNGNDTPKPGCLDLNGDGTCKSSGYDSNASTYGITEPGQWGVRFSYGDVVGEAICSSTSGTWATAGTPDTSGSGETKYCWCRAMGYKLSGSNMCAVSSPAWVGLNDLGSAAGCADACASKCAEPVQGRSDFRAALFGVN